MLNKTNSLFSSAERRLLLIWIR